MEFECIPQFENFFQGDCLTPLPAKSKVFYGQRMGPGLQASESQ
jgi:hypothetical protein